MAFKLFQTMQDCNDPDSGYNCTLTEQTPLLPPLPKQFEYCEQWNHSLIMRRKQLLCPLVLILKRDVPHGQR